jgi:hypothetical protein
MTIADLLAEQGTTLTSLIDRLVTAINARVHLYHPRMIVVDGEDKAMVLQYIQLMRQKLSLTETSEDLMPFTASQVEPSAVARGAAALALDNIFGTI